MATREAEMRRRALALTVIAITLCWGSATRAQVATAFYPVGPTVCQPLPSWYPRGWELMVRYPCVTYIYGSSYYPAAYYRYHASSAAPADGVTAAQSSASPSKSQQIAAIDERLSNAERAIMFSIAPLTSLPAIMTPVDPDPVASFRQLIALPPGRTRE